MAPKKEKDQDVEQAKLIIKDLKQKYQFASGRYGCEPLPCIIKRMDEATVFDQV
jgi:hypothetical protein